VFRVKPSKPAGVISVVVAVVMLGIAIDKLGSAHGHARWFLIGWCALVVVIGGLNAWSAFSRRGFTWQMVRGPGQELVDSTGTGSRPTGRRSAIGRGNRPDGPADRVTSLGRAAVERHRPLSRPLPAHALHWPGKRSGTPPSWSPDRTSRNTKPAHSPTHRGGSPIPAGCKILVVYQGRAAVRLTRRRAVRDPPGRKVPVQEGSFPGRRTFRVDGYPFLSSSPAGWRESS